MQRKKVISAYFYGYDEIIDITGEVELDFFVNSFENMYERDLAMVCFNNFINEWLQRDSNQFFYAKSSNIATFCFLQENMI